MFVIKRQTLYDSTYVKQSEEPKLHQQEHGSCEGLEAEEVGGYNFMGTVSGWVISFLFVELWF
jgi:hypothetical protein